MHFLSKWLTRRWIMNQYWASILIESFHSISNFYFNHLALKIGYFIQFSLLLIKYLSEANANIDLCVQLPNPIHTERWFLENGRVGEREEGGGGERPRTTIGQMISWVTAWILMKIGAPCQLSFSHRDCGWKFGDGSNCSVCNWWWAKNSNLDRIQRSSSKTMWKEKKRKNDAHWNSSVSNSFCNLYGMKNCMQIRKKLNERRRRKKKEETKLCENKKKETLKIAHRIIIFRYKRIWHEAVATNVLRRKRNRKTESSDNNEKST